MTDGNSIALGRTVEFARDTAATSSAERIIHFYEEAGTDFAHWSRDLNIHLGLYRWGMNPFDREAMFEALNLAVADRLKIRADQPAVLLDLGCGFGAVSRTAARVFPFAAITGVTISPSQARIAAQLNRKYGFEDRIEILEEDFTQLSFGDVLADGAWAVASACYGSGADKADLIREAARVLKPGGRFVVADCFAIKPIEDFGPLLRRSHAAACRHWTVPEMPTLPLFIEALKRHGFSDVVLEDMSWRAAVSVAHAPFAVLTFVLRKLFAGERLKTESLNNLKASLLTLAIGASRSKFRYCLVSAVRV
jgi:SAM-dependent methyltransferase